MRSRWTVLIALGAAIAFAGAGQSLAQQPAQPIDTPRYVIVQRSPDPAILQQRAEGYIPTLQESGFDRVPVPEGKTAADLAAELRREPGVIIAEPEKPGGVRAAFVPNDPYYNSPGQNQAAYLDQIGAAKAWDLHSGSSEVIVAVLDSGLDLTHEDFAGRLWENAADADGDGVDDDGNGCIDDRYGCRFIDLTPDNTDHCGYRVTSTMAGGGLAYADVMDDHAVPGSGSLHSHGTLVSGIIAANGNNGRGIAGMAWNVKLMTVKVLDCGRPGGQPGGSEYNLAEGINYAVRMGAHIINLSVATPHDEPPLRQAIADAQAAGVIIVAASGNIEGSNVGVLYPAAYTEYPNVIAVGGTDNNVSPTAWWNRSRYGPAVDFAAPQASILSTMRSDLGFPIPYGATPANGGGTSYAAPFVAGTFALMKSRNPFLSAAEYIQIARDTATPPSPAPHGQNWAGSGIINAGAAIARVPMTISGVALHDWMYVPNGTPVRAVIDSRECGSTVTQNSGVISFFQQLRVRSAAEQDGCGAPGKTVQIQVAGAAAQPTFTWGGRDQSLGLAGREVSSVTPPPGSVVVQSLNGGWSNIAVLDDSGELPNMLSLAGWKALYKWNPLIETFFGKGAYDRFAREVPDFVNSITSLSTYDAVWIDAPAGNIAMINPNPPPNRTISLVPGWNNFVYTGSNKEVKDALAGIAGKYSLVLQYSNQRQEWDVYSPGAQRYQNDFGGLFKLQPYWIYVTEPATLTMN